MSGNSFNRSAVNDSYKLSKSEPEDKKLAAHNLVIEDRTRISVSGVTDVESYDENEIILYTSCGTLTIKGYDLHITKLSIEVGDISATGEVVSATYSGEKISKGNVISRIFK